MRAKDVLQHQTQAHADMPSSPVFVSLAKGSYEKVVSTVWYINRELSNHGSAVIRCPVVVALGQEGSETLCAQSSGGPSHCRSRMAGVAIVPIWRGWRKKSQRSGGKQRDGLQGSKLGGSPPVGHGAEAYHRFSGGDIVYRRKTSMLTSPSRSRVSEYGDGAKPQSTTSPRNRLVRVCR